MADVAEHHNAIDEEESTLTAPMCSAADTRAGAEVEDASAKTDAAVRGTQYTAS